jgi:hypothetical protein
MSVFIRCTIITIMASFFSQQPSYYGNLLSHICTYKSSVQWCFEGGHLKLVSVAETEDSK